jgi:hypothetical protein
VRVWLDFIEFGDSDPRKRGRRGNGRVIVQNADDNGQGALGVCYTVQTSPEAWIYSRGFFCVCIVLCS